MSKVFSLRSVPALSSLIFALLFASAIPLHAQAPSATDCANVTPRLSDLALEAKRQILMTRIARDEVRKSRGRKMLSEEESQLADSMLTAMRGQYGQIAETSEHCGTGSRIFADSLKSVDGDLNFLDDLLRGTSQRLSNRQVSAMTNSGASTIRGRVTDAATLQPVAGAIVRAYDSADQYVSQTETDSNGNYALTALPADSYSVRVSAETYVATRTASLVTASLPFPGTADFAMTKGARISGKIVTGTGSDPAVSARVAIFDSSAHFITDALSDSNGNYVSYEGLSTGSYYVTADGSSIGASRQLYKDLSCDNCSVSSGTSIAVTLPATTSGIDFRLPILGVVTGTVKDASALIPVSAIAVQFFQSGGGYSKTVYSGSDGTYRAGGLNPGNQYGIVQGTNGYSSQIYNQIPCSGCNVLTGTPIPVELNVETTGIDFVLQNAGTGRITGTVVNQLTGAGISGLNVDVYSTQGFPQASRVTDSAGIFNIPLPPGTYFVSIPDGDYAGQLYSGKPCSPGCSVTSGTPVTVSADTTTNAIDFSMTANGTISGHIIDASTGLALAGAGVSLYSSTGFAGGTAYSDSQGNYRIHGSISPGTYDLVASLPSFLSQVYQNLNTCDDSTCDFTSATPVVMSIGSATSGIDFALSPAGSLSGSVKDALTSQPVSSATVTLFTTSGAQRALTSTDYYGNYSFSGLRAGTYFLKVSNMADYSSELFRDKPCGTTCDPTGGTPVSVVSGTQTSGIVFAVDATRGRIAGRIIDAETASPIGGVFVYFRSNLGQSYTQTGADGRYSSAPLAAGSYTVNTSSVDYFNQVYQGIPCTPVCPLTAGTPVNVANGVTNSIDFALSPFGVLGIFPNSGPPGGGTSIVVTGREFKPGTLVTVGGSIATIVSIEPTRIVARTPPHAPGTVSITIKLPSGTTVSIADAFSFTSAGSEPYVVKDLNSQLSGYGGDPASLVVFNGRLYFLASDRTGQRKLWRTDGTDSGTQVVDFNGVFLGRSIVSLAVKGNLLFVTTGNSSLQQETLWRSDGTGSGTFPLMTLHYPDSANISDGTAMGSNVFFKACVDGDCELWKTDGTLAGTAVVRNDSSTWSANPDHFNTAGSTLFFLADQPDSGRELWKSDGTSAGTAIVRDLVPGPGSPLISSVAVLGARAYFIAREDGGPGPYYYSRSYVFESDGTEAGTDAIQEIDGLVSNLVTGNGFLNYVSYDPKTNQSTLWRSDGTAGGTSAIKTIQGSAIELISTANGTFFVSGASNNTLWRSDGTSSGTTAIKTANAQILTMTTAGDLLYFVVQGSGSCSKLPCGELWASDGTAPGTRAVRVSDEPYYSGLQFLTDFGGSLYFGGSDSAHGSELWKSDGTQSGTSIFKDLVVDSSGDSTPMNLLNSHGELFFTSGSQLWRTDGTSGRTVPIMQFSSLRSLSESNGLVYFVADDGIHGLEPWRTDGTPAGTFMLADTIPGGGSTTPDSIKPVGSRNFFSAAGTLWRTDGTVAGTVNTGIACSKTIAEVGSILYYENGGTGKVWASDGNSTGVFLGTLGSPAGTLGNLYYFWGGNGFNSGLWRTDGTPAGTVFAEGIFAPSDFVNTGTRLIFTAGSYVWGSDGTFEGTKILHDGIWPGLALRDGKVFFSIRNAGNTFSLWSTDGTVSGTTMIGPLPPFPSYLTAAGSSVVFSDETPFFGVEPWISDGTASGTYMLGDLKENGSSDPGPFTVVGSRVFFSADVTGYGRELVAAQVPVSCSGTSIDQQPLSQTSQKNQLVTLSTLASGVGPFTYQWYAGPAGNTSNPISGETWRVLRLSPSSTTSYWVRVVSNGCGSVDSAAATITIPQPAFTATPNPVVSCDGTGLAQVTINWSFPGTQIVEIHLGSPTGPIFARGSSSGTAATGKWATNGLTFYAQNVTGGLPLTAANTLGTVTVVMACGTSSFTATPNPINVCDGSGLGATTLNWDFPAAQTVEIHLGSPSGPIFTRAGGQGSITTGKWVRDGMAFYAQNVTGNLPLTAQNTLGVVTANVTCQTSRFTATPNPASSCDVKGTAVMTLSWDFPGLQTVEIHLSSPNGPIFARGAGTGSATTGKWVKSGMTFYAQNVSGGLPLTAANTVGVVTASVICFEANPNPIKVCDSSGKGLTTLTWSFPSAQGVEIHLASPTGPLFASSGSSGTSTTGKWVPDGLVFYAQNVSGGLPLTSANTLGTTRVSVTSQGCP